MRAFDPTPRLRAGLLSLGLFLQLLALLPFVAGAAVPDTTIIHPPNSIRVLACGDSITQGQEGDFTWRYRLWEWFRDNHKSNDKSPTAPLLEYVGPYNGTLPASVGSEGTAFDRPQTDGAYHPTVDPAFYPGGGSAHFAVYGRPAWLDVDVLTAHVALYAPDVVVLHLGFNDLGWWSQTDVELVETQRKLLWNARIGRRDVTVLIADVSHRLRVEGREDIPDTTNRYNRLLREKIKEWTTPESPVYLVPVSEEYDCTSTSPYSVVDDDTFPSQYIPLTLFPGRVDGCPAGIDGLHPNALGDFQIARAYTKVLHSQLRLGTGPLVVPPVQDIPGLTGADAGVAATTATTPVNGFPPTTDGFRPPVGLIMGVSLLCLVAVVKMRPRWTRRAFGGSRERRYQRLPTMRQGMDEI